MLDMHLVRKNPEEIAKNIKDRGGSVDVETLLEKDKKSREIKTRLDNLRKKRNQLSKDFQQLTKADADKKAKLMEESKALKEEEAALETEGQKAEEEATSLLSKLPNFTHPESPFGHLEEDNKILRHRGEVPTFDFEPKDHVELMEALDLIDFEAGARVAGQKFYFLKNEAVFLELALLNYGMRVLQAEGFTPVITPDVSRESIFHGIGFQPKGPSAQIYSLQDSDLCLIATAEIPLGGSLAGSVLSEEELPLKLGGISHCFRTEAGSAGRESRGLYRVHQFSKVEMFAFTTPEDSEAMHHKMLAVEERIFQELGVPYRVVDICRGDLGAPAYRKFDLEAWMPGRKRWGEITSTSNCTDYQARRLGVRYKKKGEKGTKLVHMLNGTAIATSRAMIALLENGQRKDGSIGLPSCLGLPDIVKK